MKQNNRIFTGAVIVCIIFLFAQTSIAQSVPKVSIISSDILYVGTEVTKSNNRHSPGSDKAAPVITYYKKIIYALKFSVIIREHVLNSATPLDIKLTSPGNNVKILHVEEDISGFSLNELYRYDVEVQLDETGWFTFEIGKFSYGNDQKPISITYDKSSIYVKK